MVSQGSQNPHQQHQEEGRLEAGGSAPRSGSPEPGAPLPPRPELARKLNLFRLFRSQPLAGKRLSGSAELSASSSGGSGQVKKQASQRNCCLSLMRGSFAGSQRQIHLVDDQQQRANERRASSNQVDHLVRMILDKNGPAAGEPAEEARPASRRHSSLSHSSEMLILLGSARCPSGPPPADPPPPAAQQPVPDAQLLRPAPPATQQVTVPERPRGNRRQAGARLVGALMPRSLDRQQHDRMEQERLDQLIALLDQEEPSVMNPATCRPSSTKDPLYLEPSWTDLVQVGAVQAAEQAGLRGQQDAIWEMLSTEAFYIQRIRVVVELFLATLLRAQRHSLLLEVDVRRVLGNIDEVYAANCAFWNEHLLPMLEEARSTRSPLDPSSMRAAFVQVRSLFEPYYRYCWDYGACLRHVKELSASNELFKVYLAWCEAQKDCERLRLADLMAKPMQRLTRYPLLLKAIQKRCERPDQSSALADMVSDASRFVLSVDLELRRRDDARWLLLSERRIDSFDIGTDAYSDEIERLVRTRYTHFDLQAPLFRCKQGCQRQLLFDSSRPRPSEWSQLGQLKFRDGQMSGKLDVVLLVFTDHLFVCKQTQAAGRARPPGAAHSSARNLSSAAAGPGASALLRPPSSGSSGAVHAFPRHAPPGAGRHWRARTSSNSQVETGRPASLSPRASSLTLTPAGPVSLSASTQDLRLPLQAVKLSLSDFGHTSSAQSLAGSAARDFFRRSADAAAVAGNSSENLPLESQPDEMERLCADSDSSRLRVIRSPYPIERLVLHELKDGASVFCCQLNDARTVASSFVLYTQVAGPSEAGQSAAHQASAEGPQDRATGSPRRRWSDARWRSPHCNVSPARQLIQMIRQAQVRLQTAASFHGVRLTDVAEAEAAREPLPSAGAEGRPPGERPPRTRLTSWSSFRQSKRLQQQHAREAAESGRSPERLTSVSSTDAGQPDEDVPPAAPSGTLPTPLAKAALEQYQAMLLSHGLYERLSAAATATASTSKSSSTCDQVAAATDLQLPPPLLAGASGSQSSVFEDPARSFSASPVRHYAHLLSPNGPAQQSEARVAAGSGRRHFSRSARVSNNLELSSDAEAVPPAVGRLLSTNSSPLTSTSSSGSTTHSSLLGQVPERDCPNADCEWRRKSWHMVASGSQPNPVTKTNSFEPARPAPAPEGCGASVAQLPGGKASPRRNLSALRRQNVILSVSGEHQQPAEQMLRRAHELSYATKLKSLCLSRHLPPDPNLSDTSTTTSGPSLPSSAAPRVAGSSQATTVDQMSVTFDDWLANELPERPHASGAASLDEQPDAGRATSFELGNLRAGGAEQAATVDLIAGSSAGGVRSASVEASGRRAHVSVTLTLASSGPPTVTCAGQPRRQPPPVQLEAALTPHLDVQQPEETSPTSGQTQVPWTRLLSANEPESDPPPPSAQELARQRRKLTLRLEPQSLEREPVEVPLLNVTTASPQNCDSSCEFLVSCPSSDSSFEPLAGRTRAHSHSLTQTPGAHLEHPIDVARSRFSSPDWSTAGNEEPVRRATSTNALESSAFRGGAGGGSNTNSGSDDSMHFLRRCQNYLRSQRQNRRLSKMSLMKATKIDLDSSSRSQDSISSQATYPSSRQVSPRSGPTGRLRLALSDAAASEQQQSGECDETQALIDVNCLSNLVHPREHKTVTGYLGFHEKLQLHNKRLLEQEERRRREQRRRLTRSATGDIFDSLLRATSKVSGSSRRVPDERSDHS